MNPVNYSYIPVSISLVLELIFPYLNNLTCLDSWIAPPLFLCKFIYIGLNVVFGILLWKANALEEKDDALIIFIWILFVINLAWVYYYKKNRVASLTLLFLSLTFGYFVYNVLFLSKITRPSPTSEATSVYLNLFCVYIIWIGLMITILVNSSIDVELKILKNKKLRKR